jgi:hypothetical protein
MGTKILFSLYLSNITLDSYSIIRGLIIVNWISLELVCGMS